jgi:hypothetical protein
LAVLALSFVPTQSVWNEMMAYSVSTYYLLINLTLSVWNEILDRTIRVSIVPAQSVWNEAVIGIFS